MTKEVLKEAVSPSVTQNLSPAMRQYLEQKRQVGDALLLFRIGDFYETFYDDAKTLSRVLGITLTARSKEENAVPLAGIPYHALDSYLRRLVAAGFRVAISEQVEDPRTAKGVVRREVSRIVTPGTLTDQTLLHERDDNHLAALCDAGESLGLALVELASGRFTAYDPLSEAAAMDELVRIRPAEILIASESTVGGEPGSPSERVAAQLHQLCNAAIARRPPHEFSAFQAQNALHGHFGVATLAGHGWPEFELSLHTAGAIIAYLRETQKTTLGHINTLSRHVNDRYLLIDHNTWRALEVERTLRSGERRGSLLDAVDRTVHPLGARLLRRWLRMPLRDGDQIALRQAAVESLRDDDVTRRAVRAILKELADVERITARVALGRAAPRDVAGLSQTLQSLPRLRDALRAAGSAAGGSACGGFQPAPGTAGIQPAPGTAGIEPAPGTAGFQPAPGTAGFQPAGPPAAPLLEQTQTNLDGLGDLADLLAQAIRPDAPMTLNEGGIVAAGFDAELDRLHAVARDGQSWLADYQQQQIAATGIPSLKVAYNSVFGYYIEVTNTHSEKVPANYVRRQTVKNAERYITDELKRFEDEVLTARDRANALEARLFEQVRLQIAGRLTDVQRVANAIAALDVLAGWAELAGQRRYVRPTLADGPALDIIDGRHPVLEQTLADAFVPNDCQLDPRDARVVVITGPNMAGKSTYIRQVALLVLLAQTGCPVPAVSMSFSLADRVFARIGASDELTRGQSTFMVEMTEAANILNHATSSSLVVLDEIGRGTSTFDGLSLAWAITEHLANRIGCRTLVATHYHELTELATLLAGVHNYNVAVHEDAASHGEGIVFLHKIVAGGADKSYGIHVARLAGVPRPVIERSRELLAELERGFSRESQSAPLTRARTKKDSQLSLFRDPAEELVDELGNIDVSALTPVQALNRIAEWQRRLRGD